MLNRWKVLNVRTCGAAIRKNDPLKPPVDDPDDQRLLLLIEFGDMARKMAGKQGCRIKQLSKDTALAIHQTCYGLVAFCRHLLSTSNKYELLG